MSDLVKRLDQALHFEDWMPVPENFSKAVPLLRESRNRIEELESMLPEDNRPCSTDRFLVAVVDEIDDHHDRLDAIKCWIEGAWDEAVEGTTLAALKGQGDE